MRGPDFQKREAKQCLWDNDGTHTVKAARNRGKGRGKDKQLIRQELNSIRDEVDEERQYQYFQEVSEAWYCHEYGPCEGCKSRLESEANESSNNGG
jgi:hypothetical protein